MNTKDEKGRVERLIEFFKTLKCKKPDPEQADYSAWDQTEAEYQKEQAAWLEKMKREKQADKSGKK